jgi:hypothetical protein
MNPPCSLGAAKCNGDGSSSLPLFDFENEDDDEDDFLET